MFQTYGLLGLTTCLVLMIGQFDPVSGRHGRPSGLPACVSDCRGRRDGDYQSCTGCRVYVTCHNGRTTDNRPCPADLVWDDYKKRCEWKSATCTTVPDVCTDKDGKQYAIGASVESTNPCDECTCEAGPEIKCYTRGCPRPHCEQPVKVKGQCCPVCQVCTDKRGQTYNIGEIVPTEWPCTERCTCAANGRIDCVLVAYKCSRPSCAGGAKPIQLKGVCCPVCPEKVCKLPKKTGSCKGFFKRFYYNPSSKSCETFVYGGCGGNFNNFDTLEECQGACVQAEIDVCKLPKVAGRCRASIRRVYFNSNLGRCETFYYGGCGGNGNNFRTIAECKAKCAKDKQDCSKVACPAIFCQGSYKLPGDCCQRCPDCRAVSCVRPECKHGLYTPPGKCCPVCRELPDCSLVDCADVSCPGSYKLPGDCCERCPAGCVVDGLTYPSGSTFKKQCNTCGCNNGKITCTEILCDNYCMNGLKPPTGSRCGGIAGLQCPTNQVCEMPKYPKYGADLLGNCCADTSSFCPNGGRPLANTHCKPGHSVCPNRYTCQECDGEYGVCCPDCRTVKCAQPRCKNTEILPGQCCRVCRGCTNKKGEQFEIGASVPDENPCNYCTCAKDGKIRCAKRRCAYLKCARNFKAVTLPGKCCPTCVANGCINKEGELFKIGAIIPDENPCNQCTCKKDGQIRCVAKRCAYPKCPTNFQAVTLPGKCCPTCVARECVDKDGSSIRNGSNVPNKDPCTFCSCDNNGQIQCASISCALPKCDWNTKPFTPPGKCCPICIPTGCTNKKGEQFEIGASVPDENPCNYCTCAKDGKIRCAKRKCASPKCARNFKAVTPPGKCCPTCVAKGCINKEGELFKIGAIIPDENPCNQCTCTKDGQIRCVPKLCAYPKCDTNFKAVTLPGKCCPTCVARECVDKDGSSIKNGSGVPNKDPCTFCSCGINGQIQCASISCALPKCEWNTKPFTPPGKCCPICMPTGCTNKKGEQFEIGASVPDENPCNYCTCANDGKIRCVTRKCAYLNCARNFKAVTPPGKCCPTCVAKGCIDKEGELFKIGAIVPDENPCNQCTCTKDGQIRCVAKLCAYPKCATNFQAVTLPGKCCPTCVARECVDKDGSGIRNGSSVPNKDPCAFCSCDINGQIQCASISCALPKCDWNTKPFTPPGKCCPICIPTGCTNKKGEQFEIGASVPDENPCNYCTCAKDGKIRCATRKCAYLECARNFKAVTPPGKCCPTCVAKGCINKEGELFKIGAIIPDEKPCHQCTCTKDGQIRCVAKQCAYPKCATNFQAVTLPGKCCPTCVARECVNRDGSGIRNESSVPNKDPCTFCSCDNDGQIQCASISCAFPKCDWNTKPFTPPGKCCPICMPIVCLQPKNTGRKLPFVCNKKLTRYFYNSKSGKCERFTFRGCFGNGNNFRSLSSCKQTCKA